MITLNIEWIDEQLPDLEQRMDQLAAEYNRTRGMRDMLLAQKKALQNGTLLDAAAVGAATDVTYLPLVTRAPVAEGEMTRP